jgi:putrescine transport system substrate-binding protein
LLSAALAIGCARNPEPATLSIYNWVDEIGPNTIRDFEKRHAIRVNYDALTSNRVLETRLLAGSSGYDIVVPSNNFVQRLVAARTLQKLDKTRLPNLANLDPDILRRVAEFDPGNDYTIPYLWGTNGIGMELNAVTAALGRPPPLSWGLLFEPQYASKLQKCGIVWMQAEWLMTNTVLLYLGLDPSSQRPEDLAKVEGVLRGARPYVRYFDNYRGDADLVTGDICIEPASSGSILQAQVQAGAMASAGSPATTKNIAYFVPQEGGLLWIDLLAIPADAPNIDAAYRFLNYIMEPRVIAAISNATRYANANRAAWPFIDSQLKKNPLVYPDQDTMLRLHVDRSDSDEFSRLQTRMYGRIQNRAGESK